MSKLTREQVNKLSDYLIEQYKVLRDNITTSAYSRIDYAKTLEEPLAFYDKLNFILDEYDNFKLLVLEMDDKALSEQSASTIALYLSKTIPHTKYRLNNEMKVIDLDKEMPQEYKNLNAINASFLLKICLDNNLNDEQIAQLFEQRDQKELELKKGNR